MQSPIALDLRDVTVRYGPPGSRSTRALDGVTLTVPVGGKVGVLGGPGAGTTTLLLCAAGLVGPDTGSVRWFGSHRWAAARAAYVPAAADGHQFLSVRAWLEFAAEQRCDAPGLPDPDVDRALARAALTEFAQIRVGHLTPGVAARVGLAAALLVNPRLLLVDRALDALGMVERARFAQVLDAVHASGAALVVASRDATALAAVAPHRIQYMAGGRVAPAHAGDAALELDVPLPVEARSRLALRVPSVYRRGRSLRVPLGRCTAEQVLSECRALGIEVRSSRVVSHDLPTRRRVAEPTPGGFAPQAPEAPPPRAPEGCSADAPASRREGPMR